MKKIVNGVYQDMSQAEMAEFNEKNSSWDERQNERTIAEYTSVLDDILNKKAHEKQYSSGVSCASYAGSTNPIWASESAAFISWRDACYIYAFDYLNKANPGEIDNPSLEGFVSGIPEMSWPE